MDELTYKPRMQVMMELLIRTWEEIGIKCLMQEMHVMKAIRLFSKPKVHDAKYFGEQMLLAIKDEAGSHRSNGENDFMHDNAYGEELLDELTASVHASSKAHEQVSHEKRKTIIQTTNDDQIDSSIIFDDPYVDNKG
ncbi:hypothetical protein Tco_1333840, partial [Tanacetum coccineum]